MFKFEVKKIKVRSENNIDPIVPKNVNVIIGPNNSGKSRFLKELSNYLSGKQDDLKIIDELKHTFPIDYPDLDQTYAVSSKMIKDGWGNWGLKVYANTPTDNMDVNAAWEQYFTRSLPMIGGDWKTFFENLIKDKDYNMFFQHCGALFFQYVGTEERLVICKTQRKFGLDTNQTNYLSAYRFKPELLCALEENVKQLFHRDIYLDVDSLGDRLTFRVGKDFTDVRGKHALDEQDAYKLLKESKLDEQGDGLKSYVSTFLALNAQNTDILLLDEPEAFLHPPLARQMGELIGSAQKDDRKIFVATHSVEVLKGILSTCQDVNVIRITQPEVGINNIKVLNKAILDSILNTPMYRVSRVMEGLFCKKVILTEAEADELIYQELIEKLFPQSGIYFAHGQNKQTLVGIAELYKEIGVDYEIIVDFDVLRKADELSRFLKLMDLPERNQQKIINYSTRLRNQVNESVDKEGKSKEEILAEEKEKRNTVYHKLGINFFKVEIQKYIIRTLKLFSQNHVHVLESGELETILVPYGLKNKEKSKWIGDAIQLVSALNAEDINADQYLYQFLYRIVYGNK